MKNTNKRDVIILIILIPIFLWISLNFSSKSEDNLKPYTVLNNKTKGFSVMYETMKELNYPTELSIKKVQNRSVDTVQIISQEEKSTNFDVNNTDIKNWIEKGGNIIYLSPDWKDTKVKYGKKIASYNKEATVFSCEKGKIVVGNTDLLINKTLVENTDGAYWILEQMGQWKYEHIEFNEYYHYAAKEKPSLWKDTPRGIKLIVCQLLLLIICIIIYKGKRFGKVVLLYEEVERSENEQLLSVASLYQQAGCWEVVFDHYYKDFLIGANKVFVRDEVIVREIWFELWEKEELGKNHKAKKLYEFSKEPTHEYKSKKKKAKKFLEIILIIEELKKILEKRRERNWRNLTRDIQKI
ncbi:hypothetical protein IZY60_06565 [Lutibacter sp. B2]|nr:hypothetical protein [Lutibacter sp. B2]